MLPNLARPCPRNPRRGEAPIRRRPENLETVTDDSAPRRSPAHPRPRLSLLGAWELLLQPAQCARSHLAPGRRPAGPQLDDSCAAVLGRTGAPRFTSVLEELEEWTNPQDRPSVAAGFERCIHEATRTRPGSAHGTRGAAGSRAEPPASASSTPTGRSTSSGVAARHRDGRRLTALRPRPDRWPMPVRVHPCAVDGGVPVVANPTRCRRQRAPRRRLRLAGELRARGAPRAPRDTHVRERGAGGSAQCQHNCAGTLGHRRSGRAADQRGLTWGA